MSGKQSKAVANGKSGSAASVTCVVPISFTLPDGRVAPLRGSAGARKRIRDHYGKDLIPALTEHGDSVGYFALWAVMHDQTGQPFDDEITPEWLLENIAADQADVVLTSVISAFEQGRRSPKEIEDQLKELGKKWRELTKTGSIPSLSALRSSESQQTSSGGGS